MPINTIKSLFLSLHKAYTLPTQSLHFAYTIYVLFDLKHAEKKDLPYEGTKKSARYCNFFD